MTKVNLLFTYWFPKSDKNQPLSFTPKPFLGKIDHCDHHLTTTHANAREACADKASRAFVYHFRFVHNRRKTA